MVAITKAIRERRVGSEPLFGRFVDEANYNALLLACFAEVAPGLVPEVSGQWDMQEPINVPYIQVNEAETRINRDVLQAHGGVFTRRP